jgi:4-amino-4-deoxy-L-arabinose transferase-like glycosyltransferase
MSREHSEPRLIPTPHTPIPLVVHIPAREFGRGPGGTFDSRGQARNIAAVSYGRTSVLILVLLFLAVLALTNPVGDFPLNDDWSYGQAVHSLVSSREYRLTNWTSMPLLTQVLWGALFSLPAGFSFTALRFSTLLLSLAALLCLLLLVRSRGERLFPALLAPLLLLFNPVYLDLSHTFMTDVPFIAFTLGSLLLLVRGTEERSRFLLGLGMCLALLATLLRQTGVLIPIAFGIGYLSSRGINVRRTLLTVCFLALTVIPLIAYTAWLSSTGQLPTGFHAQWDQISSVFASGLPGIGKQIVSSLLTTYVYLGLFTLPFGLFFVSGSSRKRLLTFALASAVLLAATRLLHVGLPGNILSDRGVGPFTLAHSDRFTVFSGTAVSTVVLGLLALVGGALLLEMLTRSLRSVRSSMSSAVSLSFAGLCLASISFVSQFDRYMLLHLPLLLVPASFELRRHPPTKPALTAAFAATLVYAVFSVSAVHDYMAWNRTRWLATRYVTNDLGVPPERIDGGFEFNGLYTYSEAYVRTPSKSPWWVKDDEYVIAFDVLPGYEALKSYTVKSWIPAGIKHIYVLKRAG